MQYSVIKEALDRDFTLVKDSQVEGLGVFAKRNIPKGSRIIEYKGERISKKDLILDMVKGLTSLKYVMNLTETIAIDGERNGNEARFINHSCEPNCTVYYFDDKPFIYALREISEGEELSFDYQLVTENPEQVIDFEQKKAMFPCQCGSVKCRGTLFSID
ncbi:MAG: SET domain-containing protein-lysine N-methyltransferase [Cytophagaceae bacterium]|nr:SET domain-containing protein-lysine N-methyltransferase [Cytophagaceae bacterium]MBK9510848.1 SET domain-containing protein-lysine N-methyltransferase [Cytophagaceae bacterium]MBK9934670.1 SET domain-containing protein-lysine N-methyltransferase [Cytophagaceae bacterium]MBL0301107.1 SET domain-containing protein-lysine N-methyltransferase [Cytophagaceae bacterium]MBL0323925.1 SET domain-containing protein-lysine N-methyltransferase [Cytophagaceae bacterium]